MNPSLPQFPKVGQQLDDFPGRLSDSDEAGALDPALRQLEIENLRAVVSLGLVDGESALVRWQLGAAVGAWLTRTEGDRRG